MISADRSFFRHPPNGLTHAATAPDPGRSADRRSTAPRDGFRQPASATARATNLVSIRLRTERAEAVSLGNGQRVIFEVVATL